MFARGAWYWIVILDDDNNYNCDIIMDKMALDEQRKNVKDYESDLLYFGMSDKTRKESLDFVGRIAALSMNPNLGDNKSAIPECKEDYKKKILKWRPLSRAP